jgi:hypothetical protein
MKFITFLLGIIVSANVFSAGDANHYKVEYVRVDKTGKGFIQFKSALTGSPASCTTSYTKALAFNTNTDGGKAILSLALSAQASGRTIRARGTGTCANYGIMEDYDWGYVK